MSATQDRTDDNLLLLETIISTVFSLRIMWDLTAFKSRNLEGAISVGIFKHNHKSTVKYATLRISHKTDAHETPEVNIVRRNVSRIDILLIIIVLFE